MKQLSHTLPLFSESRLPVPFGGSLSRRRELIRTQPAFAPFLAQLSEKAAHYRGCPPTVLPFHAFRRFETDGDRQEYEQLYFDRRGRLGVLALSVWLWEQEADIRALEDALWAICDEYTWCLPAHLGGCGLSRTECEDPSVDLFAAETAFSLCEISALTGKHLTSVILRRIGQLVRQRVLEPFAKKKFDWEASGNNWTAVCAGSVGIAAMYTLDGGELAAILPRCQAAIDRYLSGFGRDGSCLEGISYWHYGFSFFSAYAEMLCRMTGGHMDWFSDPRVHPIALFQQKMYFPDGSTVRFSDCALTDTARWWGLTSLLKQRCQDVELLPRPMLPDLDCDPCWRWNLLFRDLVWGSDGEAPAPSAKCHILPQAQWLICSSGSVHFAVKGGCNAEPHNHNDVGTLQLIKNGDHVLLDCGAAVYDRAYFGPERSRSFVTGSQGHCVPIVDGCFQKEGSCHRAAEVHLEPWSAEMDIAPAYGMHSLSSLRRGIRFDPDGGRLSLRDVYCFASPVGQITERFVTVCRPTVYPDRVELLGEHSHSLLRFGPGLTVSVHREYPPLRMRDARGRIPAVYVIDLTAVNPETGCELRFTVE